MFFQNFLKQEKKAEKEINAAEKFLEMIKQLLLKDLQDHQLQHHLLYTANRKLALLKEQLQFHRTKATSSLKIGEFHKEQSKIMMKEISDLQCLVDCYMEIQIDLNQMNHRLWFYYEQVNELYESFTFYKTPEESTIAQRNFFFIALKEDCLEIIRKVL